MKNVKDVERSEVKEVFKGIETTVRYGETPVVAYVGFTKDGRLLILPQIHAEYINPIEVKFADLMIDEYIRERMFDKYCKEHDIDLFK